jgi:lysophospholipase L1-like esterase
MSARRLLVTGLFVLLAGARAGAAAAKTKVACVGASTTRGSGASAGHSYPDELGRLLGGEWDVGNFGLSGATVLRSGDVSYWKGPELPRADAFAPNVVVLWMGGADSKVENWDRGKSEFLGDYKALIKHFQDLPTHPRVITMLSIAMKDASGVRKAIVDAEVQPLQRQGAAEMGVPIIDTWAVVGGHPEWFADGVHLKDAGYLAVAKAVQAEIVAPPAVDAGVGADAVVDAITAEAPPDAAAPPDMPIATPPPPADAAIPLRADAGAVAPRPDAGTSRPVKRDGGSGSSSPETPGGGDSASGSGGCSYAGDAGPLATGLLVAFVLLVDVARRRRR